MRKLGLVMNEDIAKTPELKQILLSERKATVESDESVTESYLDYLRTKKENERKRNFERQKEI